MSTNNDARPNENEKFNISFSKPKPKKVPEYYTDGYWFYMRYDTVLYKLGEDIKYAERRRWVPIIRNRKYATPKEEEAMQRDEFLERYDHVAYGEGFYEDLIMEVAEIDEDEYKYQALFETGDGDIIYGYANDEGETLDEALAKGEHVLLKKLELCNLFYVEGILNSPDSELRHPDFIKNNSLGYKFNNLDDIAVDINNLDWSTLVSEDIPDDFLESERIKYGFDDVYTMMNDEITQYKVFTDFDEISAFSKVNSFNKNEHLNEVVGPDGRGYDSACELLMDSFDGNNFNTYFTDDGNIVSFGMGDSVEINGNLTKPRFYNDCVYAGKDQEDIDDGDDYFGYSVSDRVKSAAEGYPELNESDDDDDEDDEDDDDDIPVSHNNVFTANADAVLNSKDVDDDTIVSMSKIYEQSKKKAKLTPDDMYKVFDRDNYDPSDIISNRHNDRYWREKLLIINRERQRDLKKIIDDKENSEEVIKMAEEYIKDDTIEEIIEKYDEIDLATKEGRVPHLTYYPPRKLEKPVIEEPQSVEVVEEVVEPKVVEESQVDNKVIDEENVEMNTDSYKGKLIEAITNKVPGSNRLCELKNCLLSAFELKKYDKCKDIESRSKFEYMALERYQQMLADGDVTEEDNLYELFDVPDPYADDEDDDYDNSGVDMKDFDNSDDEDDSDEESDNVPGSDRLCELKDRLDSASKQVIYDFNDTEARSKSEHKALERYQQIVEDDDESDEDEDDDESDMSDEELYEAMMAGVDDIKFNAGDLMMAMMRGEDIPDGANNTDCDEPLPWEEDYVDDIVADEPAIEVDEDEEDDKPRERCIVPQSVEDDDADYDNLKVVNGNIVPQSSKDKKEESDTEVVEESNNGLPKGVQVHEVEVNGVKTSYVSSDGTGMSAGQYLAQKAMAEMKAMKEKELRRQAEKLYGKGAVVTIENLDKDRAKEEGTITIDTSSGKVTTETPKKVSDPVKKVVKEQPKKPVDNVPKKPSTPPQPPKEEDDGVFDRVIYPVKKVVKEEPKKPVDNVSKKSPTPPQPPKKEVEVINGDELIKQQAKKVVDNTPKEQPKKPSTPPQPPKKEVEKKDDNEFCNADGTTKKELSKEDRLKMGMFTNAQEMMEQLAMIRAKREEEERQRILRGDKSEPGIRINCNVPDELKDEYGNIIGARVREDDTSKVPITEILKKVVPLSAERKAKIAEMYSGVAVRNFDDEYHKEPPKLDPQFKLAMENVTKLKSKYKNIVDYIYACRTMLTYLKEVAYHNRYTMDPQEFIYEVLHGDIILNNYKMPRYTGKDRKDYNWKLVGKYVTDEWRDPEDFIRSETEGYDDPLDGLPYEEKIIFAFGEELGNIYLIKDEKERHRQLRELAKKRGYSKTLATVKPAGKKVKAFYKKYYPEMDKVSAQWEAIDEAMDNMMRFVSSDEASAQAMQAIVDADKTRAKAMKKYKVTEVEKPKFHGNPLRKNYISDYEREWEEYLNKTEVGNYRGKMMTRGEYLDRRTIDKLDEKGFNLKKMWGGRALKYGTLAYEEKQEKKRDKKRTKHHSEEFKDRTNELISEYTTLRDEIIDSHGGDIEAAEKELRNISINHDPREDRKKSKKKGKKAKKDKPLINTKVKKAKKKKAPSEGALASYLAMMDIVSHNDKQLKHMEKTGEPVSALGGMRIKF
mgnify:CR=1 FL=1